MWGTGRNSWLPSAYIYMYVNRLRATMALVCRMADQAACVLLIKKPTLICDHYHITFLLLFFKL
jgi:hypothetical protein